MGAVFVTKAALVTRDRCKAEVRGGKYIGGQCTRPDGHGFRMYFCLQHAAKYMREGCEVEGEKTFPREVV